MVKLTDPSLASLPRLRELLAARLPRVEADKAIVWRCFCATSRLPEILARDVLRGKLGSPQLIVANLDRKIGDIHVPINGSFRVETPNAIYLCSDIATKCEQSEFRDDPRFWPVVESTILHELVHWADFRDGTLEGAIELGKQFEICAYGQDIGRYWGATVPAVCGFKADCADLLGQGDGEAPEAVGGVPFATAPGGLWPVRTADPDRKVVSYRSVLGRQIGRAERSFAARRPARAGESLTGDRHHVGVDLYGRSGDAVIACEDGEVVGIQNFYEATKAMLVQGASGIVVNYGEIADASWGSLRVGSRVRAGQPIAKLGRSAHGAMCHFETYKQGVRQTSRWAWGQPCPAPILNPTAYLLSLT